MKLNKYKHIQAYDGIVFTLNYLDFERSKELRSL